MHIALDRDSTVPIYEQVARGIRAQIASAALAAGSALPPVRALARELGVNANTISRAYGVLRAEGVLEGRSRLGTRVATHSLDGRWHAQRATQLQLLVAGLLSDAVARGYSLADLESVFTEQRLRWQADHAAAPASLPVRGAIIGLGSHDVCLDILLAQLRQARPEVSVQFGAVGSLAGLLALGRGEIHFATAHLHDAASDDYNLPSVRQLIPDAPCALITLAHRTQGLMVARGNPRHIAGLPDLTKRRVRFVNRQRGSGTRGHLDELLRRNRISARQINGYGREEPTHVAVAAAIAGGHADAGLGIEAAARSFGLEFIPLFHERFEIIVPRESQLVSAFREHLAQRAFRETVSSLGGYDLTHAGDIRYS